MTGAAGNPQNPDGDLRPVVLDMDALTGQEQGVLGSIAVGFDGGHPTHILRSLESGGLIESHDEQVLGYPPATVRRYQVPVAVHIQWASWCAAQPGKLERR